MSRIKTLAPGIAVSALIAVVCWFLGQAVPLVGGAVFAILLGMVIGTFWKQKGAAGPGIKFASKKILQTAVVLLGFGLPLTQLAQVGVMSLPVILSTISASLITTFVYGGATGVNGTSVLTATLVVAMKDILASVISSSLIENLLDKGITVAIAWVIVQKIPRRFLSQYAADSMGGSDNDALSDDDEEEDE